MCNGNSTFPIFKSVLAVNKDFSNIVITPHSVAVCTKYESIVGPNNGIDEYLNKSKEGEGN